MALTAIEWLRTQTKYTFEDTTFEGILEDRGVEDFSTPHTDLTFKQKQLMLADLIFVAVMMSPSSTGSHEVAHTGFSEKIGSETTTYSKEKINYALKIYQHYDDPKYNFLKPDNYIRQIEMLDKL